MSTVHLPAPVAHWDFTAGASLSDRIDPQRTLRRSEPGAVPWRHDEEVGGCMVFAGDGGHLRLPPEEMADLDLAGAREVTVIALVRREGLGQGFIAGSWQEQDSDPRRQYGLFIDLPAYGGADQVIGHVSRTGGASAGLPYSRDYAASARMVRPGQWRVIAFRHDGEQVTAFLDGITDPRPEYQEPGPPLGQGLRYAKNPYLFEGGLYDGPLGDFTIGAVLLSSGIGNAFRGSIAQVAVWDAALPDEQIRHVTALWTPKGVPLATFDWWRREPAPARTEGGEDCADWSMASVGIRQTAGTGTPVTARPLLLSRAAASDDAVLELPLVPAAARVVVEEISDPARLSLTVRGPGGRIALQPADSTGEWVLPALEAGMDLELRLHAGERISIGAVHMLQGAQARCPVW